MIMENPGDYRKALHSARRAYKFCEQTKKKKKETAVHDLTVCHLIRNFKEFLIFCILPEG